jgi:hypothetical protein
MAVEIDLETILTAVVPELDFEKWPVLLVIRMMDQSRFPLPIDLRFGLN